MGNRRLAPVVRAAGANEFQNLWTATSKSRGTITPAFAGPTEKAAATHAQHASGPTPLANGRNARATTARTARLWLNCKTS